MASSRLMAIGAVAVIVIAGGAYYAMNQGASSPGGSQSDAAMSINFGNNSWDELKSVEISAAGKATYTMLPLVDGKLGAGEFLDYSIADGRSVCTYDMRFTKADGTVFDRNGVNLCEATFYHFEDK